MVNTAIAASPTTQFTHTQVQNYVSAQKNLSVSSLADSIQRGSTLPNWAPYGQLFMVGNCSGLYLSSGFSEANVPGDLIDHYAWIPVEQDPAFTRQIWFTFNGPAKDFTKPVTLMTYGAASLVLQPVGTGSFRVALEHSGTSINWPPAAAVARPISVLHEPFQIRVTTDPNLHQIVVTWYGDYFITHYIAGAGPAVVHATPAGGPLPEVSVVAKPVPSNTKLCRSLQRR
jgi:hypothetical protein